MKRNIFQWMMAGAFAAGLAACDKSLPDNNIPQTYPDNGVTAYVKFIHAYAGKSPALTTGAGPNVILYLSDSTRRINGVSSPLGFSGSGGQFPAPSTATTNARSWYTALPSGPATLMGVLARVTAGAPTPAPGDTIFRSNVTLEAGKNYTAFLSDTMPTPSITLIPDNVGTIPDGKYKIRLANFLAWPGDIQEIYSTREGRVIQGNIGYKTAGEFIELNVPKISDTLIIRKVSGPSPGTYTTTINGFFPTGKRAYTITTRGKQLTGTSTVFQNYGTVTTTNY
ncbi:MAG: DUF4397 domain-containing protein [Chitinophagaceae bacterium]|nr:DUF4397 domain-containing protein [Chitinophagaceae bacterium]